jgi:hypothetical protein
MPHGRENFRAMIEYATTASRSMKQEALRVCLWHLRPRISVLTADLESGRG